MQLHKDLAPPTDTLALHRPRELLDVKWELLDDEFGSLDVILDVKFDILDVILG